MNANNSNNERGSAVVAGAQADPTPNLSAGSG